MRCVMLVGLCCAATFLAAEARAEGNRTTVQWSELSKGWETAQKQQRPLMLFITMDGCTYCDLMKAQTLSDPTVVQAIHTGFVPAIANRTQRPDLVRKLGVTTFPTTLIISPQRKVLGLMKGYVSSAELKAKLDSIRAARVASAK